MDQDLCCCSSYFAEEGGKNPRPNADPRSRPEKILIAEGGAAPNMESCICGDCCIINGDCCIIIPEPCCIPGADCIPNRRGSIADPGICIPECMLIAEGGGCADWGGGKNKMQL